MANGWDGADPTLQTEPGIDYELGVSFLANDDIRITALRVWAGATSASLTGRTGRLWTSGGASLATVALDESLPPGWTTYVFADAIEVASGNTVVVSYGTITHYGATAGGYPNPSADALVTATDGRFNGAVGSFPTTTTASFYGIDIVYQQSGDLPPDVTGVSVVTNGLQVTATATVDDEEPSTVTIDWHWGDGTVTGTAGGVLSNTHTYAAAGTYALMALATDEQFQSDAYATVVTVKEETTPGANEAWLEPIFDAVVSDWQATGYFSRVNQHQPRKKPDTPLTAAVWLQSIRPVGAISGLAASSGVLVFIGRMYWNTGNTQEDQIEKRMMMAASAIMRRYHDDFDFDLDHLGVRNVDLFGMTGIGLSVTAGYLEHDRAQFRVYDMVIPVIVNDIWTQAK